MTPPIFLLFLLIVRQTGGTAIQHPFTDELTVAKAGLIISSNVVDLRVRISIKRSLWCYQYRLIPFVRRNSSTRKTFDFAFVLPRCFFPTAAHIPMSSGERTSFGQSYTLPTGQNLLSESESTQCGQMQKIGWESKPNRENLYIL